MKDTETDSSHGGRSEDPLTVTPDNLISLFHLCFDIAELLCERVLDLVNGLALNC